MCIGCKCPHCPSKGMSLIILYVSRQRIGIIYVKGTQHTIQWGLWQALNLVNQSSECIGEFGNFPQNCQLKPSPKFPIIQILKIHLPLDWGALCDPTTYTYR